MKREEIKAIIEKLKDISTEVNELILLLEKNLSTKGGKILNDVNSSIQETQKEIESPLIPEDYTLDKASAILASKIQAGYRNEVKSLIIDLGVQRLAQITDQATINSIVENAKKIGEQK